LVNDRHVEIELQKLGQAFGWVVAGNEAVTAVVLSIARPIVAATGDGRLETGRVGARDSDHEDIHVPRFAAANQAEDLLYLLLQGFARVLRQGGNKIVSSASSARRDEDAPGAPIVCGPGDVSETDPYPTPFSGVDRGGQPADVVAEHGGKYFDLGGGAGHQVRIHFIRAPPVVVSLVGFDAFDGDGGGAGCEQHGHTDDDCGFGFGPGHKFEG